MARLTMLCLCQDALTFAETIFVGDLSILELAVIAAAAVVSQVQASCPVCRQSVADTVRVHRP